MWERWDAREGSVRPRPELPGARSSVSGNRKVVSESVTRSDKRRRQKLTAASKRPWFASSASPVNILETRLRRACIVSSSMVGRSAARRRVRVSAIARRSYPTRNQLTRLLAFLFCRLPSPSFCPQERRAQQFGNRHPLPLMKPQTASHCLLNLLPNSHLQLLLLDTSLVDGTAKVGELNNVTRVLDGHDLVRDIAKM